MPKDPKLTPNIKAEMDILEPKLKRCVKIGDFNSAKKYMIELQNILKPNGYNSRLMKNKIYFFEAALEKGEIDYAISGLIGVRNKVSDSSRMYLESTALLAVCYIRMNKISIAQGYVDETIRRINNIISDELRREFHRTFLKRIDDEMILNRAKEDFTEPLNEELIHQESILIVQSKTEDEMYELIGKLISESTIKLIGSFQKNNLLLLPLADRKFLPPPVSTENKRDIGEKFSLALKRVIWKGLCNPDSDLYQAWSNGLSIVHDKKYITIAVATAFANYKIGSIMLAATIVAMAVRFGVNMFCEMFEPETIMEKRVR
jgi:hypothetical protein